jgi:hypothetical protein
MKYLIGWLATGALIALALVVGWAQDTAKAEKTPQALTARIEALKPKRLAWRQIAWKSCLLEGLRESRATGKPILLWVFIDRPTDDARC